MKITLTDADKKQYFLEFNRDIVASMEDRGITLETAVNKPVNTIPLMFFWAFKMNHPKIRKDVTDEIWNNIPKDGKKAITNKLMEMYSDASDTLMGEPEDDSKKVSWEIG